MPSTDVIKPILTLKTTTAQVVELSVTVNNNSPIQDYIHLDDQTYYCIINYCNIAYYCIIIICNNVTSLLLLSFHLFLISLQLAAAQLIKSQNPHPCIGQRYKHTIKPTFRKVVKEWVKGFLV